MKFDRNNEFHRETIKFDRNNKNLDRNKIK